MVKAKARDRAKAGRKAANGISIAGLMKKSRFGLMFEFRHDGRSTKIYPPYKFGTELAELVAAAEDVGSKGWKMFELTIRPVKRPVGWEGESTGEGPEGGESAPPAKSEPLASSAEAAGIEVGDRVMINEAAEDRNDDGKVGRYEGRESLANGNLGAYLVRIGVANRSRVVKTLIMSKRENKNDAGE